MSLNQKCSKSLLSILAILACSALVMPPVFAQDYLSEDAANSESGSRYSAEDPDNSGQLDITRGLAEQNGAYAVRNGKPVPQQFLQGFASQNQPGMMQNGGQVYYGHVPAQGLMGNVNSGAPMQGFVNQNGFPLQAQQGYNPLNGNAQMMPLNGTAQMLPMNAPMNGNCDGMPMDGSCMTGPMMTGTTTTYVTEVTQESGFKVNTQVVGAVGAALMLNYITQGGAQSVMGSLGSRGWRGGRRTLGSGGVVFH